MGKYTLARRCLVNTKLALDHVRPYKVLGSLTPFHGATARALGATIHPDAKVKGPLRLCEPCWFQMNRGAKAGNVTVDGMHCVYVGEGETLFDTHIDSHTLVFGGRLYRGRENVEKQFSFTVDFEGCTAICPINSSQGREIQKQAAKIAGQIRSKLAQCGIPSTWYIVGELFRDPDMQAEINHLLDDPLVDIGLHGMTHMNYFLSTRDEAANDLATLEKLRNDFAIPLTSFSFPYNATGHLDLLVEHGFISFRSYIGQYYLPVVADFGPLSFQGSSLYIGPYDASACESILPTGDNHCTAFIHPVDWIDQDISALMRCIETFISPQR